MQNNGANNENGFNTGIPAFMEVLGDNKTEMCSDKFSPLEVVLMMRADLDTVRRVWAMYPPALNGKLLRNVCCHGGQPGVIGFLAEKLPGAIKNPDEDDCLPLELAMGQEAPGPGRPTEEDLTKMIQIYPEGLNYGNWNTYLSVLCWRYSASFTEFVFKKMAKQGIPDDELYFSLDDSSDHGYRNQLDLDCVRAMAHVLPCVEKIDLQDIPWQVDALVQFLKDVSMNPNVKELHLNSPCERNFDHDTHTYLDDTIDSKGDLLPEVINSLLKVAPNCGLETLLLSFNDDYDPFFPFLVGDFPCKMPKLRSLSFFADNSLELLTPSLIKLLNTSQTLEHLEFLVYPVESLIQGDLKGLIDTLANNKVLKSFEYTEDDCDDTQDTRVWYKRLGTWQDHAAKALETNMTLERVVIAPRDANPQAVDKIKYITQMNQYGRAIARKSETSLEEFVDLLPEIGDDNLSVYYGLLRESPGCWCLSAAFPKKRLLGTVMSKAGRRSSARLAKRRKADQ